MARGKVEGGRTPSLAEIGKIVDAREGVINGTRVIDHRTPESLFASFALAMERRSLSSRLFSFSNVEREKDRRRFKGLKISFSDHSSTIHQFRVGVDKDPANYDIAELYVSALPQEMVTSGFVEVDLKGRPGNMHHLYLAEEQDNPIKVAEQENAWRDDAVVKYQRNPNIWYLLYSVGKEGATKVDLAQGNLHYETQLQRTDMHYPLYRIRDAMPRIRLYEGVGELYRKVASDPTHFMANPFARFSN